MANAVVITEEMYIRWQEQLQTLADDIVMAKRHVYTNGNPDIVRNFRVGAVVSNSTLGQQLVFGLIKQITALADIMTNPSSTDTEKDNRFADARNYIDMCYVVYKEGQQHDKGL